MATETAQKPPPRLILLDDFRSALRSAAIDTSEALAEKGASYKPADGDAIDLRETTAAVVTSADVERIDGQPKRLRFVISDGKPDRRRDVIAIDGWKLDAYLTNPVVLWAHDGYGLPIAKGIEPRVSGGKLMCDAEFAPHPFAQLVMELYLGGFLSATSVGMKPLKFNFNAERQGYDFLEHELLEWSAVNIPCNPRALRKAQEGGLDIRPMREWALQTLASADGEAGLFVPVAKLEALASALGWVSGLKIFELGAQDLASIARASAPPAEAKAAQESPAPIAEEKAETTPPPAAPVVAPAPLGPPRLSVSRAAIERAVAPIVQEIKAQVTRVTGRVFVED